MKTSMNVKVDTDVRDKAKELFGQMGLDMTTAVNMFLLAAIREKGIPFPVTTVTKSEDIEKAVAAKLRIAERQEQEAQMRDFSVFSSEMKEKYGQI